MRLPPVGELAVALRRVTETLANELAFPGRVAPHWSALEWRIARAVAAMHGVSALLNHGLRWEGPPDWKEFLETQRAHTEARHALLSDVLGRLDDAARRAGFGWVGLKGVALHARGLYRPGERPMSDLDLLVRACDVQAAVQVLNAEGFRESAVVLPERVFEPVDRHAPAEFGEHRQNGLTIELHSRVAEALPRRVVDISAHVYPQTPGGGVTSYPTTAALMMHVLLHAAGDMTLHALRLLQLNDIARLSRQMAREDWEELLASGTGRERGLWWAFPPLALTQRYYQCVPEWVLARTERACTWLLAAVTRRRTLTDVSRSRVRVSAFHGIEWAQTPLEAIVFAHRRVIPGAAARARRRQAAQLRPALAASDWVHQSHARRSLRWLTTSPGRPDTLFAIGRALRQPD